MHVKQINTDYKTLMQNLPSYAEAFKENKVLQFKQINMSDNQHQEFSLAFHEILGYFPSTKNKADFSYKEDHSHVTLKKKNHKDHILINWHLEHIESDTPQLIGTWNMFKFQCLQDCGRTIFIDSCDIFGLLNNEQVDFLLRCRVATRNELGLDEKGFSFDSYERDPIQYHPLTGAPLLRLGPSGSDALVSVDGRDPTWDELQFYYNLPGISSVSSPILDEDLGVPKDLIHYALWSQGDLVVVDTFCCYHAVLGGFSSDQRQFVGRWGFAEDEYTVNKLK